MKVLYCIILILAVYLPLNSNSYGNTVKPGQIEAELVAEMDGLVPGKSNRIAVRLKMKEGWHSYWVNPGETGLPTEIAWSLPEGITAGPIQWPAPTRIQSLGEVSYGYEGETFLFVELSLNESVIPGTVVTLSAEVNWLACREACIPGAADLSLVIPVMKGEPAPSPWKNKFDSIRKTVPRNFPEWPMKVVNNGESFALTLLAPADASFEQYEATYFSTDGWVAASQPSSSLAEDRTLTFVLPKAENEPETGRERFRGVVVLKHKTGGQIPLMALEVDLPFESNEAVATWVNHELGKQPNLPSAFEPEKADAPGFGTALLFALVGGLLLNLMPCVFPVLSLKVLGFVQQAGEDKGKIRIHGMVFTFGVLVSFWLLAGIFLILRSAGQEIGWGFQLQSPGFVAVLASTLFLFGLNLSGVFEMGESLTGVGSRLQAKSGYSGSFFSGVLATVVATPCTAPFMGSALGVIITLSAMQSMLIFTALAFGVALPYLVLSFYPVFLKWLPRPGAWMLTFKKGLAFLLYATVAWLAWVFGNQVGVTGMAALLFGLIVMGVAAWIWGEWGTLTKRKGVRRTASVLALLMLIIGGSIQYNATQLMGQNAIPDSANGDGIQWQTYTPELVATSLAEGKTVYVDFTASWCLTCQVNKKVVFGNDGIIRKFKDGDVVALKGDWTRRDPVITREIQKFGRNGVPTNIIYRPNGSTDLLPEVLTPQIVMDTLDAGES